MTGPRILSLVVLLSLPSCAASFPYRYYNLGCETCDGALEAKDPDDDLSLELCRPTPEQPGVCAVFFADELARLRADYLDMARRLEEAGKELARLRMGQ